MALKCIKKIGKLLDLVFQHHTDGGVRRRQYQACVEMYTQIMEKLR